MSRELIIGATYLKAHHTATSLRLKRGVDCLIPWFDGAILSQEWKEALWDKFVTGAPRPRTLSELGSVMCGRLLFCKG